MIYNLFVSESKESSNNILRAWNMDLDENVSEEEWSEACSLVKTQSVNTHSILLQYKWLSRKYITPVKLHHFNPNIPDTCFKCSQQKGSLFHCMWSCPQVARFWREVLNVIGRIIGKVMPSDPKLCILNIYPDNLVITKDNKSLIGMCLLEAKRCIARSWKKPTVCGVSEWLNRMTSYLALEKIILFY